MHIILFLVTPYVFLGICLLLLTQYAGFSWDELLKNPGSLFGGVVAITMSLFNTFHMYNLFMQFIRPEEWSFFHERKGTHIMLYIYIFAPSCKKLGIRYLESACFAEIRSISEDMKFADYVYELKINEHICQGKFIVFKIHYVCDGRQKVRPASIKNPYYNDSEGRG